jgi:hypothetical protein
MERDDLGHRTGTMFATQAGWPYCNADSGTPHEALLREVLGPEISESLVRATHAELEGK